MKIKINPNSKKQNFISLPARFGSITTNCFIYADSLKQIYKTANKYAVEIASRLNVGVEPAHLIQCLEIGVTAFILNQYGYVAEMQMSKEFVVFYNIAACALLPDEEYKKHEIIFDSETEFIKLVA